MKNIYFIRSYTGYYFCDYYDQKTDVWVFGDIEGYNYFIDSLKKAKRSRKNIKLSKINFNSNTMNVVILQAGYDLIKQPRLKFAERIIFINDKPEMELIIFGNNKGYDFLINIFNDFIHDSRGNLEDHFHLDDQNNRELVKRSISLNIRDALRKWDKNQLNVHNEFIYNKRKKYMPYDLNDYSKVEPYTEVETKGNNYLSLKKN